MIGYFPTAEPEELFISVLARAKALISPNTANERFARFLIGGAKVFGWTLPNNGHAIQENILPLARPSDDSIVSGSTYHILSPFLDSEQRSGLRQSIFFGGTGTRNYDSYRPLRYCVKCAQEDESLGRPHHWRILPNYPAVSCCDRHGCRLTLTEAKPGKNVLYNPEEWIHTDTEIPSEATPIEIQLAQDIRWIYDQRSAHVIGRDAITRVLHRAIHTMDRYKASGRTSGEQLFTDMLHEMGHAVTTLDPQLQKTFQRGALWSPMPIVRYLLLARFAGIEVMQLFKQAEAFECGASWEDKWVWAKKEIEAIRFANPALTREDIREASPYAFGILKRTAKDVFEQVMPPSLSGQNRELDWCARDTELAARLRDWNSQRSATFQSQAQALIAIGFSQRQFSRNKSRLPKTAAWIDEMIQRKKPKSPLRIADKDERIAMAAERLNALRVTNPGIRPKEFREQDRWAYSTLNKYAPHLMPATTSKMDWERRDAELYERTAATAPSLAWETRKTAGSILAALGESEQLLRFAAGRLPKVEQLIKSLVVQGISPEEIENAKNAMMALVKQRPQLARSDALKIDSLNAGRLQRADPRLFDKLFPAKIAKGRFVDWEQRDNEFVGVINLAISKIAGRDRSSSGRIMKAAGLDPMHLVVAKGRLAKTESLLQSLVVPFDVAEDKRRKLLDLIKANPEKGRDAISLMDRTTVDYLRIHDPAFFERVMPLSQTKAALE